MALKDIWTDIIDGVSEIEADDINLLAKHIIDLEEDEGGGAESSLTIEEVLKEVVSPDVVKDISNVVFDAGEKEEVNPWVGELDGTDRTIVDFKIILDINGVETTITKDTDGLESFSISGETTKLDDFGMPLYFDFNSFPCELEPYGYTVLVILIVYNGVEYYPDSFKSVALVLEKSKEDKLATKTEVLKLIEENIPPSGDEVSY